jgi:transcription elongation factor Elf1
MSIEVDRATVPCGVCGAQVTELRRGRCWHCYSQWAELRPVGKGASCVLCGERRRDNLRLTELHARTVALCHTCNARTLKLVPLPHSLDEIRAILQRDRRRDDRRGDGLDQRIFPRERRVGDRRGLPRSERRGDTDPQIALPDFDDLVIEIDDGDIEMIEQTNVRERPVRPTRASNG